MSNKTQIVKGFLDGFILKMLEDESLYSGDIVEKLARKGFDSLSDGTLYPLLLRLEKNGFVSYSKVFNSLGPSRKIYSITQKGIEELNNITEIWNEFYVVCMNILGGKKDDRA